MTRPSRFTALLASATGLVLLIEALDAQISFEIDGAGLAKGLVLHQGGRDTPAKRIE